MNNQTATSLKLQKSSPKPGLRSQGSPAEPNDPVPSAQSLLDSVVLGLKAKAGSDGQGPVNLLRATAPCSGHGSGAGPGSRPSESGPYGQFDPERGLTRFAGHVEREDRESLHGHAGSCLWLTGLSAAGKSTIGFLLELRLSQLGCSTYVLDGDNVRMGLCRDLGFSHQDREENIRRLGEVARLMVDAGIIVISSFISPFRVDRERARARFAPGDFMEIFVHCPLEVCQTRDPKGLYRKARSGEIKQFTGISSPYEPPENPEMTLNTHLEDPWRCTDRVIGELWGRGRLANQLFFDQGKLKNVG